MKCYNTINSLGIGMEIIDYNEPIKEFGEYIVDDSNFIPMSEAVKRLSNLTPISETEINQYYDYPDGNVNGSIPLNRLSGNDDIAVLSTEIRKEQDSISKEIQSEIDYENEKKRLQSLTNS